MTYVIAQPCVDVKDRACVDECPVDCIYEGERTLYINADECVDCGACEPVCPTEAIFYEDDVPEEWDDYTRANIDFFELKGLGSPGGAQKTMSGRPRTATSDRAGARRDVLARAEAPCSCSPRPRGRGEHGSSVLRRRCTTMGE